MRKIDSLEINIDISILLVFGKENWGQLEGIEEFNRSFGLTLENYGEL